MGGELGGKLLEEPQNWALRPPSFCLSCHLASTSYHSIRHRIGAEGSVLGGERLAGCSDQERIASAGCFVCDVNCAWGWLAAQHSVVWLAHGQEMWSLVAGHHLACIGKDGGSEEAEGINTYERKSTGMRRWSRAWRLSWV